MIAQQESVWKITDNFLSFFFGFLRWLIDVLIKREESKSLKLKYENLYRSSVKSLQI